MTNGHADRSEGAALLVRAGARLCALPLEAVIETMRPLQVAPLAGVPPFVAGVAVVRGEAVPVITLAAFLGDAAPAAPARFVTVRAGARTVALGVDAVAGVAAVGADVARRMPLVEHACAGAVEALGARDAELVLVLRAARLVPEELADALSAPGARG